MSVTDNKKYRYLVEGQCEEKLLNAMKLNPSLVHPGKVDVFSTIQDMLPIHTLMKYEQGTNVVLVFDTDKDDTEILKKNIERLKSLSFKVEVLTVLQVRNFEEEIERVTDIKRAQDLTKSKSVSEFKNSVVRMKESEFRNSLKRHKFDITKALLNDEDIAEGRIKNMCDVMDRAEKIGGDKREAVVRDQVAADMIKKGKFSADTISEISRLSKKDVIKKAKAMGVQLA